MSVETMEVTTPAMTADLTEPTLAWVAERMIARQSAQTIKETASS